MLREAGCRQKLGFFLHIPFPVREIFATLPMHDRLARALMAYDLIGFQTESDVQRFRDYVLREAGGRDRKSVVSGKSVSVRVDLGGRRFIKKKKTNKQKLRINN